MTTLLYEQAKNMYVAGDKQNLKSEADIQIIVFNIEVIRAENVYTNATELNKLN